MILTKKTNTDPQRPVFVFYLGEFFFNEKLESAYSSIVSRRLNWRPVK